jgi:general secretion pathway protein G
MTRKNTGFTLVEILIVVIILGILAAIVIPQFSEASNEARQSSLVTDLQTVRSQIELYKIQHQDIDPATNATANSSGFWEQLNHKTDANGVVDGGTLGRYLEQIPANPFVMNAAGKPSSDVFFGLAAGAAATDGWAFDAASGIFGACGTTPAGDDLTAY